MEAVGGSGKGVDPGEERRRIVRKGGWEVDLGEESSQKTKLHVAVVDQAAAYIEKWKETHD